jgi:TolA-binding protein
LLLGLLPLAAECSDYMLFSPRPFEGELLMPERGKGLLVRRITIKRGDTLSHISRDFSGKGSYYPQILLFNEITNPDLIFAGKELLVPVSRQDALSKPSAEQKNITPPVKKDSLRKPKPAAVSAAKTAVPAEKKQRKVAGKPIPEKQLPGSEQRVNTRETESYSKAISAYRSEDYKKALSLFNRFLERYPSSSMAADASLYKAECLLKLSGQ